MREGQIGSDVIGMRSGSGGGVRAASSDRMADAMVAMLVFETTGIVDLNTKVETSSDTTTATAGSGEAAGTTGIVAATAGGDDDRS